MATNLFGSNMRSKALELKFRQGSKEYQLYHQYFESDQFQKIEGCSDHEIASVAAAQKVSRLPQIYVEYLRHFGRSSGDLFLGLNVDVDDLITLKEDAMTLLIGSGVKQPFPADAFIFRGQQNHTYWYFLTHNTSEDPPVYVVWEEMGMHESEDELIDVTQLPYHDGHGNGWKHLSEFLTQFIRERESEKAYQEFLRNNT